MTMTRQIVALCAALSVAGLHAAGAAAQTVPQPAPVPASPPPAATGGKVHDARSGGAVDGKALFQEKCAMCHDKAGMGTGLLARRVQPAELEARTDLDLDYVTQAARSGIGNMPAIPRGEVSDSQMRAIAAYLAGPKGTRP